MISPTRSCSRSRSAARPMRSWRRSRPWQCHPPGRGGGCRIEADALAVLLPDTPLVTAGALTRALHTLGPVVLAPSIDEGGTNLIIRRPPDAIEAHFGTDSYRKHLEAAAMADLPTAVVGSPELAFDLDLPGDILTVLDARRQGRTRRCLPGDGRGIATRDPQ